VEDRRASRARRGFAAAGARGALGTELGQANPSVLMRP
jgi:hypothetical protein